MNHLASWLRRGELDAEAERKLARILLETGAGLPEAQRPGVAPGDARALRGVPFVGVHGGLGGAIAGTNPEAAALKSVRTRAEME